MQCLFLSFAHFSTNVQFFLLFCKRWLHPFCCSCCCSVPKLHLTLCNPVDCSTSGFPVPHHLLGFAQIHVHWIGDAIQPSLSSSSPSQHQGLFQWVSSLYQVAKVLELQLQLQHQSFQWVIQGRFPLRLTGLISQLLIAKFKLNLKKEGKTTRSVSYDSNQHSILRLEKLCCSV